MWEINRVYFYVDNKGIFGFIFFCYYSLDIIIVKGFLLVLRLKESLFSMWNFWESNECYIEKNYMLFKFLNLSLYFI